MIMNPLHHMYQLLKYTSIDKYFHSSNISFSIVKLNIEPREMNAFKMIIPFVLV